jgi:Bacterial Ig-like domain
MTPIGSQAASSISSSALRNSSAPARRCAPGVRLSALPWGLAAVALAGCGAGGNTVDLPDQTPSQIGAPNTKPGLEGLINGSQYLVDVHQGGVGEAVRIVNVSWGRLIDIYDRDDQTAAARLVYQDIVVGEDVRTEVGKWVLETNPVTGRVALTIERENTPEPNDQFDELVLEAQLNLGPVLPKGVSLAESPPFSFIARNSCMVVQFDDLIDPDTIALNDSVKLSVGNPPVTPFDVRLLLDSNHGGISATDGKFHSTRLIVDMTINQSEQLLLPEALALNGAGLPASVESQKANVALRIPTRIDEAVGQFELLTNLKGRPLTTTLNGPVDLGVTTLDVVRALRSGNSDDQNNGFLTDLEGPQLIGRQGIQVSSASPDPIGVPGYSFVIGFSFVNPSCALDPAVGDVIQVGTQLQLSVTQPGAASQGTVAGLRVSLPPQASPLTAAELLGPGIMATPWRASLPGTKAPCFVRFSPNAGVAPNLDVVPAAQVVLEFSEAMDPASVRPFDSFFLRNKPNDVGFRDFVVGDINASPDLREFRFTPLLPFNHQLGTAEVYFVDLISSVSAGGVSDLAGNELQATIPQVSFTLKADEPSSRSGGFVLRFNAVSEDDNPGTDLRGQFLYNLAKGEIRPRPFSRFPAVADRTTPIVSQMQAIPTGLQTPLSNLGSKLHILWRYCDVGLPQAMNQEDVFANLDVEGISLSPLGGQVTSTFYPQFEMRLGHSGRLPDEEVDQALLPQNELSGFFNTATYAENYLADADNPPMIVHPRELGFLVSSSEVFTSTTGTTMVHFPMNRTVAPEDKRYYTWRDTAIQTWGGRNPAGTNLAGPGVPVFVDVTLSGAGVAGDQYGEAAPNEVIPPGIPTVGLPLLMEFRCYPGESLSVNNFDVSIAINSSPRPFFRAFSTGGFNPQGTPIIKNPDSEGNPTGGFNGNPQLGQIGAATNPRDPTVYIGQLDLVTRVSRVHTVLFNTQQGNPDYAGAVLEPRANLQPLGTAVVVAYRGDDSASLPSTSPYFDTADMDVYGEPLAATNALLVDNQIWSTDINKNDGQRFVQLRLSFISNPITELSPTLSGIGVAWKF